MDQSLIACKDGEDLQAKILISILTFFFIFFFFFFVRFIWLWIGAKRAHNSVLWTFDVGQLMDGQA